MKVIFTCGGTAGHVNPAIALAGLMQKKNPGTQVLFVGSVRGMEKKLVEKSGYKFIGIKIDNFRRSFAPSAVKHNLGTVQTLITAPAKAKKILREFQPDLVVGTGGYASYPMVKWAAKAGIPTAVHESNMVPGLTTQTLEAFADRVMVGFEECRQYYKKPKKVIVTGTPVRGDFFEMTKAEAREKLGFHDNLPLVVTFWGSLGASHMNEQMVDFIKREAAEKAFHHIYAVGSSGYVGMCEKVKDAGIDLAKYPLIDMREYIFNMAEVMRAADIVICRAGASTISEITALAVPSIIVPSPYVVNNHQEKNARALSDKGAADIVLENDSTGDKLYEKAMVILNNSEKRANMSRQLEKMAILDATQRIYDTVMSIR